MALLYLGYDALQPAPPPPPAPMAVAVATPAPSVAPKVYFHSALDAPAMRTGMTTGTSYFSTDPNSRFSAGYGYNTSGSQLDINSTTIVVSGGRTTAGTSTNRPNAPVQTQPPPTIAYVHKETPRPTPNSNGTAR